MIGVSTCGGSPVEKSAGLLLCGCVAPSRRDDQCALLLRRPEVGSKVKWSPDGSLCPACGERGRNSPRYPAALCERCVSELVDRQGRPARARNAGEGAFGGGLLIEVDGKNVPEDTPLFARGIECRAKEAYFGGVVI